MKISSPISKFKVRLELIPLIDIIFFLLATFAMLSLSMGENLGIEVKLPAAQTSDVLKVSPSAITISIDEAGNTYLDKQKITKEALAARLKKIQSLDPKTQVVVNADEKTFMGNTVAVLDLVRKAGLLETVINVRNPAS